MANDILLNTSINDAKLGSSQITGIYKGSNLVWGTGTPPPTYPLANIISEYKFENNVLDTVGINNGTDTDLTYTPGLVGQTGVFNGATTNISCGNDISLKISSGSITLLIKTLNPGTSFRGIALKSDAYGLFIINNELALYSWGVPTGIKSTGININDNIWHHVTLTFDDGVTNGTKIYLDGVLSLTTTIFIKNQNLVFQIGANTTIQNINASIDCVRVWDKILNQSEITKISTDELNGLDINP